MTPSFRHKEDFGMKVAYPVFINPDGDDYLVYIPDFDGYTEGKNFCDAMDMARDYMCCTVIGLKESEDRDRPNPSTRESAIEKARKNADENLDFSDIEPTFVDVDFDTYRSKIRNLSVRKNCTLPQWLERKAAELGVNFSQVLQEALMDIVGSDA